MTTLNNVLGHTDNPQSLGYTDYGSINQDKPNLSYVWAMLVLNAIPKPMQTTYSAALVNIMPTL